MPWRWFLLNFTACAAFAFESYSIALEVILICYTEAFFGLGSKLLAVEQAWYTNVVVFSTVNRGCNKQCVARNIFILCGRGVPQFRRLTFPLEPIFVSLIKLIGPREWQKSCQVRVPSAVDLMKTNCRQLWKRIQGQGIIAGFWLQILI